MNWINLKSLKLKVIFFLLFYHFFNNLFNYLINFLFFNLEWIYFFCQPFFFSFLNLNASNMNPEIWANNVDNTNVAEAAHSLANREGKQFKLLTAIIKYLSNLFNLI